MDNPLHLEEGKIQKVKGLQVFSGVLRFLSNLVNLTEEEKENAGIYLGGHYDNNNNNIDNKENMQ